VSDIAEFLRARYAEQRAVALAADGDRVEAVPLYEGVAYLTLRGDHPERYTGEFPAPLADHVAANDPRSVLADLDAKLAILDWYEVASSSPEIDPDAWQIMRQVLLLLAVPFAAHPDYRERWCP
jgi:hypothetical protein